MIQLIFLVLLCMAVTSAGASESPSTWPPRDYLLRSLLAHVPHILKSYHADSGRFGTEPWTCMDQNVIFPLAAAWAIEDADNPHYHDAKLLDVIARGGEALVDDQDEKGMWVFRKKDNSTWGMIHMPWTYSRWIRAYQLVCDALPEKSREKWERGLLLGFRGIRKYADGRVHNIPAHHAMALFIAGQCFDRTEWQAAAKRFMKRVVEEQDPGGFWSEHFGPVVGYNRVYVDALGVYYHFSHDPLALAALERSARFHAAILWPDGSAVSCIDERQIYHHNVDIGNVGFSWTATGRAFLQQQLARFRGDDDDLVSADYAASMLLYGGRGDAEAINQPAPVIAIGARDAVIVHESPWHWALSAYACPPIASRWIQDRQNLVDVFHEGLGLVAGGGNTKLQPYWSTFTVGDTTLLSHKPGDESPAFTPDIDLLWTPHAARIDEAGRLALRYGERECSVSVEATPAGDLRLTYSAPTGRGVEAHLPLLYRSRRVKLHDGTVRRLGEETMRIAGAELSPSFTYGELQVAPPPGASLLWPARPHNPYAKDGKSHDSAAKLVLRMPFTAAGQQTVVLTHRPEPEFRGLSFEARELPFTHSEGPYAKRLDDLGSQFLGRCRPGDWIEFRLPEVKPGRYELLGEFVMAYSYGIVRVLFDGEQVGKTFDGYCEGVDAEGERASFGEIAVTAGNHGVRVEIVGKNNQAAGSWISVKRWLLRPLDDG